MAALVQLIILKAHYSNSENRGLKEGNRLNLLGVKLCIQPGQVRLFLTVPETIGWRLADRFQVKTCV